MSGQQADPLGLVGTTIAEKYAVESVVGAGGFAVVYRAMHLLWKVPVALKVFNALGSVSKDQRQKLLEDFLQEGKLLQQLSGKTAAILQARDVAMLPLPNGESVPYMVLEWLEGRSLDTILEEEQQRSATPRTLEQAVKLLDPIADALAIAHEQGIVHRDLKPANIFVLGDPANPAGVKLLDFGIAKVVQDAEKMGFSKTAGHVTSFTPYYGAPEQFDRTFGATSPATDVFALALVVVEMISGRSPLAGDSLVQLAYVSCDPNKRPTPRTLGVLLPDDAEVLFARALAVQPASRFPTAGEFWHALRVCAGMISDGRISSPSPSGRRGPGTAPTELAATAVAAPPPNKTTIPEAPPRTSPAMFVAGGIAMLLAAGGVVAFALSAKKDGKPTAPLATASGAVSASAAPSASASAAPAASKCPEGMAYVDGSEFFMGYDQADAEDDEKPVHKVKVAPYCLDIYEVTAAKYRECSGKAACKRSTDNAWTGITKAQRAAYDPLCTLRDDNTDRANHPVNCIDWDQAVAYCAFRGARLPTEAEWEFAARTPDQRVYPWGDAKPTADHLNACGNECLEWQKAHPGADESPMSMYNARDPYPTTAPVGQFASGKTRFGIYDMVGNVFEWVADWYGPYDAKAASSLVTDPKGPAKGAKRVMRGGAWNSYDPSWLRPSYRFSAPPSFRTHGIGFRCAAKPLD